MKRIDGPVFLVDGSYLIPSERSLDENEFKNKCMEAGLTTTELADPNLFKDATRNTISYDILKKHSPSNEGDNLSIKFDALASHDITYVGIIQSARHSGLTKFPVPYILTNCHNSLCAVGGTINEDDHIFGLGIAKKYGGVYVPAFQAVIHQYIREKYAACGSMIIGSDSHTRYGALGCMGFGEGGPELVKQLVGRTYEISYPKVIAVYLEGIPAPGVGPQDVALALIREVFHDGFVKNCVLEFVGPGIKNLSVDFRNSLDTMTTETTCISSIWMTDEKVLEYFSIHGRKQDFSCLAPGRFARYDAALHINLDEIKPMIALPFHPSNVYTIEELNVNAMDILSDVEKRGLEQLDFKNLDFSLTKKVKDGRVLVDQGSVAGCAGGTYENISAVADILSNTHTTLNDAFWMSVYPASQPINAAIMNNGIAARLINAGVSLHPSFCGPCFGAGDTPGNGCLSIRHATRNFPHREGSKPQQGQISMVALMDARSVAATARNEGMLTAATEFDVDYLLPTYHFDDLSYQSRVYQGFEKPIPEQELIYGPYIADWPDFPPLPQNLVLKVAASIQDPITTTDEIIPSGETSSYRSNPEKFAEFTLSRKVPEYVQRAKDIRAGERERERFIQSGVVEESLHTMYLQCSQVAELSNLTDVASFYGDLRIGSVIFAKKPGDGSAREQAASCQKVLGGWANIALEYATKRYRSNLINWGIIPFIVSKQDQELFEVGSLLFLPNFRSILEKSETHFPTWLLKGASRQKVILSLPQLSDEERNILLAGCLMNYYRNGN